MNGLADALLAKHPTYELLTGPWSRYRAFGGGLETVESKNTWLPQGRKENDDDYKLRLQLTHDMGWSAPALRRIGGTLTKEPATFSLDGSKLSTQVQTDLEEWRKSVDGNQRDIDSWWGDTYPDTLRMGISFVEVCRDSADQDGSGEVTPDGLPYLCTWDPSEVINWSLDKRGALEWVVLHRVEHAQASPTDGPSKREVVRILTRDTGQEWVIEAGDAAGTKTANVVNEWEHGLGMVPVVPVYAHRIAAMVGRSYIDQISLGDWRKLQLESDQAIASYLHASPWLVVKTSKEASEIVTGTNRALHLNSEDGEDAYYLSLDAAGMDIRERIIERTSLESLNSAGIDPAGVATSEGVSQRSGVSLAWSFSTSEEPTLNSLVEEMDAAERLILEVVTRYLVDEELPGPHERIFDGKVTRSKQWDLMSVDEQVGLTVDAGHKIKSETWHKANARRLAQRILPDLDSEEADAIGKEIEDADYSTDLAPVMEAADEIEDGDTEQPTDEEGSNV